MKTSALYLMLLVLLNACGNSEIRLSENAPVTGSDTLDANQIANCGECLDVQMDNLSGAKNNYRGDSMLVTLKFQPPGKIPESSYRLGMRAVSEDVIISRKSENKFYMIFEPEGKLAVVRVEVFLSSDEVIFKNAYYDSLYGYAGSKAGKSEFGKVIQLREYALQVEGRNKKF